MLTFKHMDKYLVGLIERMTTKADGSDPGIRTGKTVSFLALREAEKLSDEEFVPQLMNYIENEKDRKKREMTRTVK